MKNVFFRVIILISLPLSGAFCQNTTTDTVPDIEIFDHVLKTADWAKFKYKDVLERAKGGDYMAIRDFLNFHATVDGVDGLNHAVTCLELIPVAGDEKFAAGVAFCSENLRKVLIDRFILAQGRTKKTALRQSMTDWAPNTWEYLNGRTTATHMSEEKKPGTESSSSASGMSPDAAGAVGSDSSSGSDSSNSNNSNTGNDGKPAPTAPDAATPKSASPKKHQ
ncbi:MAG: hypothetical protein IPK76_11940 [Lewinellaceae bacterium]|jgi:hypothetical protein|nr:hypothetical protein [Lewinellaceae bacterium]